jgi:hypothetical protein
MVTTIMTITTITDLVENFNFSKNVSGLFLVRQKISRALPFVEINPAWEIFPDRVDKRGFARNVLSVPGQSAHRTAV